MTIVRTPIAVRFERQWTPEPNTGCWLWTGPVDRKGYGYLWSGGRRGRHLKAHRVAYELFQKPIPVGLTIDHLCRVRCCVNPEHLEAVSMRVNTLRGMSPVAIVARRNVCANGHPYDDAHLHITRSGTRKCRACNRLRVHAAYWRNPELHRARKRVVPKSAAQEGAV